MLRRWKRIDLRSATVKLHVYLGPTQTCDRRGKARLWLKIKDPQKVIADKITC